MLQSSGWLQRTFQNQPDPIQTSAEWTRVFLKPALASSTWRCSDVAGAAHDMREVKALGDEGSSLGWEQGWTREDGNGQKTHFPSLFDIAVLADQHRMP